MRKNDWKNYNFEKMSELTSEQLKSFRKVTAEEHNKFKKIKIKKVGRPTLEPKKKENIISIQFSEELISKIKKNAKKEGVKSYQKYIKEILREKVG